MPANTKYPNESDAAFKKRMKSKKKKGKKGKAKNPFAKAASY